MGGRRSLSGADSLAGCRRQVYMGDRVRLGDGGPRGNWKGPSRTTTATGSAGDGSTCGWDAAAELAQNLCATASSSPGLTKELYVQLVQQLVANPR